MNTLGRILTVTITIFWVAMIVLLTQWELMPNIRFARAASQPTSYHYLERLAVEGRASQMGLYFNKRRIGYTLSRMRMVGDELHLESRTEIKMSLSAGARLITGLGQLDISTEFLARVEKGELLDFRLKVSSPPGAPPLARVEGVPEGQNLRLHIRQGDNVRVETIPFDSKELISSSLGQAFALPKLHTGLRWKIHTLDPISRMVRVSTAEVVGKEMVRRHGEDVETFVIRIPYGTTETRIWANSDREILKQQVMGLTFLKEDPPEDTLERSTL